MAVSVRVSGRAPYMRTHGATKAQSFPLRRLYAAIDLLSYNSLQTMSDEFAPDLRKQDRDDLEAAGMSPRAIDDAIAALRLKGAPFTAQDVLAIGPLRRDELPEPPLTDEPTDETQ